ncbi:MAG TPA: type II toxin-antitoxin system VapC family toxin [bacterium]|nr:type II toxin-antitoxin system VapC family toxin [bacterium]HPR87415.1 type II toxin-antitoxin system VapC family toxin [bacterium]
MNLNKIAANEMVLLDANIFLYALQQQSQQCMQLLRRCAEDQVIGYIADNILAEVMHILMVAEARDNNWITTTNPARQLSEQPKRAMALLRYEGLLRDLLSMGLRLESLQREDFITALAVQRHTGLLTNDALFVALAMRLRIKSIASADQALSRVPGILFYSPDDLILE